VGSSHIITKSRPLATRVASATSAARLVTRGRLCVCNTLRKRLAQDLEDMPPELRPFIQEAPVAMGPRHLARRGDEPAADQPHIRDRLMRGAKRARGDDRRVGAGEAGDAMDARGVDSSSSVRSGRMVASRRTSMDLPAPGPWQGLWSEHLYYFRLCP
jgi:hypothetical protein